jgi:hypothetical protein
MPAARRPQGLNRNSVAPQVWARDCVDIRPIGWGAATLCAVTQQFRGGTRPPVREEPQSLAPLSHHRGGQRPDASSQNRRIAWSHEAGTRHERLRASREAQLRGRIARIAGLSVVRSHHSGISQAFRMPATNGVNLKIGSPGSRIGSAAAETVAVIPAPLTRRPARRAWA